MLQRRFFEFLNLPDGRQVFTFEFDTMNGFVFSKFDSNELPWLLCSPLSIYFKAGFEPEEWLFYKIV